MAREILAKPSGDEARHWTAAARLEAVKRPRAAEVFVELRGAMAARTDGFLMQITTQRKEAPAGVFRAELDMAREVRDGKIALPLLPIIYELPHRLAKDGGWKNPVYWPLVNPNIERSVDLQFLDREVLKAEEQGPQALALIASQHFNVRNRTGRLWGSMARRGILGQPG